MKIDKDIFWGLMILSIAFIVFLGAIIFEILDYLKHKNNKNK